MYINVSRLIVERRFASIVQIVAVGNWYLALSLENLQLTVSCGYICTVDILK